MCWKSTGRREKHKKGAESSVSPRKLVGVELNSEKLYCVHVSSQVCSIKT